MTSIFLQVKYDLNIFQMENNLIFSSLNGRRPQYFSKWKTTSCFFKWKTTSIYLQMEDDLNILANGRRLQYQQMEEKLNMWT